MKKVLVGGCFDLIHFGHVQFLKTAKNIGDYLVVMLESDENVKRLKGANRPIHTQKERAEMLKSLRMVNEVIMLPPLTTYDEYSTWVRKIKPDVIAITKGDAKLKEKHQQADAAGAKLKVMKFVQTCSTSKIAAIMDP